MGQGSSALEGKLGHKFRNKQLLEEAMSHDSLRGRNPRAKDYQRLEFLGDAVISFVITNYLFEKHPDQAEGFLSQQRDALVCSGRQQRVAEELGLEEFVKKDPATFGRFQSWHKFVEALIGAVFVDAGGEAGNGYRTAKTVIYRLWKLEEPYSSYSDSD